MSDKGKKEKGEKRERNRNEKARKLKGTKEYQEKINNAGRGGGETWKKRVRRKKCRESGRK